MPNDLAILKKTAELYGQMQRAISVCYSFDECKEIADRAAAMATYCKQINDAESTRMFVEIKLRAWRRIGALCAAIDDAGCMTQAQHITKIQLSYPMMSNSQVYQALQISRVPDDFFERESGQATSISGLLNAYKLVLQAEWEASPEGRKAAKAEQERQAKNLADYHKEERERAEQRRELADLQVLQNEAFSEVGITLDRRDRRQMKTVLFLISETIHETLRQAAFDQHVTMQAILRAGLATWFLAHGYEVTDELKPARTQPGASARRAR